ncbi:MAG: ABC transporter substrate-binding protein [Thermoproteota archaeon]|nr:ABC transporter substrate-binding protein [Thermoproteota archaeon]
MDDRTINVVLAVAIVVTLVTASISTPAFSQSENQARKTIRIGYFPNINHAQAVIGLGNGDFQRALGDNVQVTTQIFNAGPSAIEALFANQIDVTYIGPNPAINGYVRSDGQALRIISGSASGGAVFVVRNDSGINSPQDLANKKFATPELGNTQDVALRNYLLDNGYNTKDKGGNVEVLTVKNPDIVTLFLTKQIDGAWVPEPWGERLVREGGGKILVDERDLWPPEGKFVTTHIIVNPDYLENNPDVIKKLLEAHVDETNWINNNKPTAMEAFNVELQKLTRQTIPEDVLNASLSRIDFTYDPIRLSLFQDAVDAYNLGFLPENPDLSGIYDLAILDQVLQERGLPPVSGLGSAATNATDAFISSDTG